MELIRQAAAVVVGKLGGDITLRRPVVTTDADGYDSDSSYTDYPARAIFEDKTSTDAGSRPSRDEVILYIPDALLPEGFSPQKSDRIVIDGDEFDVEPLKTIYDAGSKVFHMIRARKGQ